MIMKKEYISPFTQLILVVGTSMPICASTNNLTQLEEKDDLEGFGWNYN